LDVLLDDLLLSLHVRRDLPDLLLLPHPRLHALRPARTDELTGLLLAWLLLPLPRHPLLLHLPGVPHPHLLLLLLLLQLQLLLVLLKDGRVRLLPHHLLLARHCLLHHLLLSRHHLLSGNLLLTRNVLLARNLLLTRHLLLTRNLLLTWNLLLTRH